MRTAEKWQEELAGETSVESIRAIQADALLGAIAIMTRHRKTDAVITALATAAEDLLSPNAPHQARRGSGVALNAVVGSSEVPK